MSDKSETLQTQLDALKATLLAQDFDSLTPESIQDMLRAFIEDDLGLYTGEGSLLQIILAPGAYVFWEGLQALRAQVPISFVDETSGRFIDKNAAGYGITRKPGTAASVLLTFTGSAGTTIPAGTLCVTGRTGLCDRRSADAGRGRQRHGHGDGGRGRHGLQCARRRDRQHAAGGQRRDRPDQRRCRRGRH